tara:strand:- start:1217 stop:1462 length:246 start_codon:yes stop_codon:yes gene_type:complete
MMINDGQFNKITKAEDDKKSSSKIKLPTVTNAQKGLISIGIVAGAAFAISKKKGLLAIMGYMWLGSIGGSGLAYLFKKELK